MVLRRLRVLLCVFLALFAVVEARLAQLQFAEREFWETEGLKTRTGGSSVPFHRGGIFDRYGRTLAEGRVVHTLAFNYAEFRKRSPCGLLQGAYRVLAEHGAGGPVPPVSAILADPAQHARAVLGLSDARVASFPATVRGDLVFYARHLLDMGEAQFAAARERLADPARPWHEVEAGCIERITQDVLAQGEHLAELARSCDLSPEEFLAEVDAAVTAMDEGFARAAHNSPRDLSQKQLRGLRADFEGRDQTLVRSVPYETVFLVNLVPEHFAGFSARDIDARHYPEDVQDLAPLLIGRTGFPTDEVLRRTEQDQLLFHELRNRPPDEIDEREAVVLEEVRVRLRRVDYRPDEEMGVSGLEAVLEPVLRGERGWRVVERDRNQLEKRLLEYEPPADGKDVLLTLDASLQLACERVLERLAHPSAVVLIDPMDGAIRAMATWPEPGREQVRRDYAALLEDPLQPLFHRAYQMPGNPPPPGSVFKVVVAAAALEAGVLHAGTTERCDGVLNVGTQQLKCLRRHAHGNIALAEALEQSCNVFFYKVARRLGVDDIVAMADRFGVGRPSGFGNPERLGLGSPARALREMAFPAVEGAGVTWAMRTAIGHAAYDDITPLQVATLMAPFANGGRRVTPYLVDRIGTERAARAAPEPIGLAASTLDAVRRGLIRVTESGSARPDRGADLTRWKVAAKTGTPEAAGAQHAWIAGFFPHDSPRFVFALYVEDVPESQTGGVVCTPVLGDLLDEPEMLAALDGALR